MTGLAESDESVKEASPDNGGRGLPKFLEGYVVSDKMNKSAIIEVTTFRKHAAYGKYVKRSKRYMVHDEVNQCREGDRIRVVECRPLSKNKRWRLSSIIDRAQ